MGPVTARFRDGTAGVYNSLEEALDQASYDRETGYRELQDVIEGAHDWADQVQDPKVVAGPAELAVHHQEWVKHWAQLAGVLMPREDVERLTRE